MLNDLYRNLVMEHAKYRRNYRKLEGDMVRKVYYKNPTCGDVITLYLIIEEDTIKEVSFLGEGCSISMASSSMMTELIYGQKLSHVSVMRNEFEQFIRQGQLPSSGSDFGDALSLQGVYKLKARHNCALMAWQALDKLLDLSVKGKDD
ncbi:Fe-S cluster assembly sulfur transfer protein SufU [Evansella halocellulosilytica]|uniref:Fe-S cluster assembly sulfur transfer protein SufU n=1 Tax=Evansella halocellulosilytica TaxID=2011013 RepID=UPI000BB981D1|nr:SUF system NifU family Fe-S cluster assembly protein [Evansella halocellulosilytica]